jgi:hypothetical protein
MERHAHGIKPPKGVSSSEDADHQECLWRWEACNLDHLLLPVEIKEKKKLSKREEKVYMKTIKAKLDKGEELDEDEEAFAQENDMYNS